jgi:hypothetical protein
MEHVSLSFNKKWHLKVCTRCGNNHVRMKPISYRIHEIVLRVFDVSANGLTRKFQVIKLSDKVASLISLLYVKLYELPISLGVIRCNEIGRFLKTRKEIRGIVKLSNESKGHVSQGTVSKLMYE